MNLPSKRIEATLAKFFSPFQKGGMSVMRAIKFQIQVVITGFGTFSCTEKGLMAIEARKRNKRRVENIKKNKWRRKTAMNKFIKKISGESL